MPKSKPPRSARLPSASIDAVLGGLDTLYPSAECELSFHNPYELIVATILSAQCTDKRVNMVTPALFARYPNAEALAAAKQADVEEIIRSTGFFRAKAKNLLGMAAKVVEEYGGQIPSEMDALLHLPGVARKTANVVLGTAFGKAQGVVVDTHVARLSYRLGLTRQGDPKKIEQDLMKKLPRDRWISFSHQLIWHGRRICDAKKPKCSECLLEPFCPKRGLKAAAGR